MLHPEKELAEYLDGELSDDRRPVLERHLERCGRCRRNVDEYRQIQERLRAMDVPPPGQDLTARILRCGQPEDRRPVAPDAFSSRTPHRSSMGAPDPMSAGISAAFSGRAPQPSAAKAPRRRIAAAVGGAVVGCAVLTMSAAYVLGGEAQLLASGGEAASGAAWAPATAGEAAVRPVAVDSSGLEELRRAGWTCPMLLGLGYRVESAEKTLVGGEPAVKIDLNNGSNRVVVTEQRHAGGSMEDRLPMAEAGPPVNATTGHPVTMDGFREVAGLDRAVWVRGGEEWTVVLDSEEVTYTLWSDLPLARMPETVNQVVLMENSRLELPEPVPADDPLSRIIRGLGMMVSPPAAE